jgi:imidazolonepropionase-like amidohydrolase
VIRNVTVMTAAGPAVRNGAVLLRDGRIVAVGPPSTFRRARR